MTNSELLKKIIAEKGYKIGWIAKQLGITHAGLCCKLSNQTEFKQSEMHKLREILMLNEETFDNIFFAKNVTQINE